MGVPPVKNVYPNPELQNAIISANASSGFIATTRDGKPLRMALVDDDGNIVEAGNDVRWAAWSICSTALHNLWECQGHLVIHSSPPGDPEVIRRLALKAAA